MNKTDHYPLHLFTETKVPLSLNELRGEAFLRTGAQMVLKLLWQPWNDNTLPKNIFDDVIHQQLSNSQHTLPIFYRALLKSCDPFFLKAARMEVQEALNRLQKTLIKTPPANKTQHDKVELCLHNMLSIYAMFNPTPLETLFIPQCVKGVWQSYEFNIKPIELSPNNGFWAQFIGEKDRLFSYGLTPINHGSLPRLLVHRGTGWSTAQGIMLQVLADLWPNKTPGEIFFKWSKSSINDWLDESPSRVITCGQSLGGSLAYLTAMHRPDKVSKAICLVPPGMPYDYDKKHPLFGAWQQTKDKGLTLPIVIIQRPFGDPVSKCGVFKKEFILKNTNVLNEPKIATSPLRHIFAHARNAPACDDASIKHSSMEKENKSPARKNNNDWLYNKARYLIFFSVILPYFFIRRPLQFLFQKNAFRILLAILLSISFAVFPVLATAVATLPFLSSVTTTFYAGLIVSWVSSYWLNVLINATYDVFFNDATKVKQYWFPLKPNSLFVGLCHVAFDLSNLMSANMLQNGVSILKWLAYDLPNVFTAKPPVDAIIHRKKHHQKTMNLSDHPLPTLEEKLQVMGFIVLFYTFAFPIKFIVYDIPSWISTAFSSECDEASFKNTTPVTFSTPPLAPPSKKHCGKSATNKTTGLFFSSAKKNQTDNEINSDAESNHYHQMI